MNKSFVTNLIAASITLVGYLNSSMLLLSIGLFALSGALTNWIAIHMLFEKIPGFYGSGVVPARFEEFKAGYQKSRFKESEITGKGCRVSGIVELPQHFVVRKDLRRVYGCEKKEMPEQCRLGNRLKL